MQEQAADRQSQEELVPSMLDGSPWVDVGDIRGEGEAAQPGTPNAGRGSNTTTVTEWMKILHAMADSFRWHWRFSSDGFRLMLVVALLSARLAGEMAAGIAMWEVDLVTAAVHGVFDIAVLGSCLMAQLFTKMPAPESFPFGFARVEVLSAFINACFLFFLAFTQCTDALSASLTAHIHGSQSATLACINIGSNLLGSAMFARHAGRSITYRTARDMNLHAVWLHLAADSLHNGGVLLAGLLREFGLPVWASISVVKTCTAALLVWLARPLFDACSVTLLQRVPANVNPALLDRCLARVHMLPGCTGSSDRHFWELVPGEIQGQIVLLVTPQADQEAVRNAAAKIFDVAMGFSTHIVFEIQVQQ
eukprot:CAMPEP_0117674004 /NCGR_PEP_ID=MMETSP0804-20121206/14793_1 /TAXON_ID=1074897 /ORGANISM="Tetraselmis astigmatica, Strain CCMP880" /LENGTH=363 /DNA_ID=CAMNT_0005482817 /DNA_START=269 /DNA_END=1360 /DNA_ORIENTATION=+